jgi:hypothetical protein
MDFFVSDNQQFTNEMSVKQQILVILGFTL